MKKPASSFTESVVFPGKSRLSVFRVFVLTLVILAILAPHTPFAQENARLQEHKGASYITNKGGDLGKLLQRTATKDAVGNFTINVTGELPKVSAQLSIYAFDVDEERGETLTIFLNDQYIGKVSGTNDSWNTSVFDVKKEILVKGINRVRFVISDSSRKGTIKWSGKVGWGQIMIDGGAAESGRITNQVLKHSQESEQFQTLTQTSVRADVSGRFTLEISMLDDGSNTVTAGLKELTLKKDDLIEVPVTLSYSPKIKEGQYQIVTNLFYKLGENLLQQDIRKTSFQLQKAKPITTELIVNNPIKTVDTTEDTKPIVINLRDLFAFDQNGQLIEAGESLIEKTVISNSNPSLVSPTIEGEKLTLAVQQGLSGEAEILIQGIFEGKTILSGFEVKIAPKPVKIPIQPLPAPVIVPKVVEAPLPLPEEKVALPVAKVQPAVVAKKPDPLPPPKPSQPVGKPDEVPIPKVESTLYGSVFTGLQFLKDYQSAAYIGILVGKEFLTAWGELALEGMIQQTANNHDHAQTDSAISVQSLGIMGVYSFYTQTPGPYSPFSQNPVVLRFKAGVYKTEFQERGSADNQATLPEPPTGDGMNLHFAFEISKKISPQHGLFLELNLSTTDLSSIGFGYRTPLSF